MHLAFVSTHDPHDRSHWAGTTYRMAQALEAQGIELSYIGPLIERGRYLNKARQILTERLTGRTLHRDREPRVLDGYADKVKEKIDGLKRPIDAVFSNGNIATARLKIDVPIVFWTDATYGRIINEYVWERPPSERSKRLGNAQDREGIERAALAIYSSDWAARSAIELYGADPAKVKVVPFGANVDESRTIEGVTKLIDARPIDCCRLLFAGVGWQRKGGDVAVEVAKLCNEMGVPTELHMLGSDPPNELSLPPFVKPVGFVNKQTAEGRAQFDALFGGSHFFVFPARAEAFGVVLCEANSYSVPNITTNVGGIPTIVKNDVNGALFNRDDARAMAARIVELMRDREKYRALALSSFAEYQHRLNWRVAGATVKSLLKELIQPNNAVIR